MGDALVRRQAYEISPALPVESLAGQEIVRLVGLRVAQAKCLQRYRNERILRVPWIQVHYDEQAVVPRDGRLRVRQDEIVVARGELQIAQLLQRPVLAADPVQASDQRFDV